MRFNLWGLNLIASFVADVVTRMVWSFGNSVRTESETPIEPVVNTTCKWCRQMIYNVQEYCSYCARHRFTGKAKE